MLTVQWNNETVGFLTPHGKGRVKFSYATEWIEKYNQPVDFPALFSKAVRRPKEYGVFRQPPAQRKYVCGFMPEKQN